MTWERDDVQQVFRLRVTWTFDEFMDAPLDEIDRRMLREPQRGIADVLHDAELIARRIEQGTP